MKRIRSKARYWYAAAVLLLVPGIAAAQSGGAGHFADSFAPPRTFADLVWEFIDLINIFINLLVAVAIVVFLWGIAQYMLHLDNEQERTRARQFMIWGIIAIFVMVSVMGIVEILQRTFFPNTVGNIHHIQEVGYCADAADHGRLILG